MLLIFVFWLLFAMLALAALACLGVALMMPSKTISCPSCGSAVFERKGRRAKDFIPWLFGYYPWRCRHCLTRFRLRQRSLPTQDTSQMHPSVPPELRSETERDTRRDYVSR